MKKVIFILSLLWTTCFATTSTTGGYFENWAQYRTGYGGQFACTVDSISTYVEGLDRLYYAFGFFRFGYDETSEPPYVDNKQYYKDHGASNWAVFPSEWNDTKSWDKADGNWAKVNRLTTQYPNLKVILSLGGWSFCSSDAWYSSTTISFFPALAKIATDAKNSVPGAQAKLDTFLNSLYTICSSYDLDHNQYGFAGVDLDWEFPGSAAHGGTTYDYQGFFDLLLAIRTKLGGSKLISIASPAVVANDIVTGTYNPGTGVKTVSDAASYIEWLADCTRYLNQVNIMCYDYYGAGYSSTTADNAPLHDYKGLTSLETTIAAYTTAFDTVGEDKTKIIVGLASYGHTFQNVQYPSSWDSSQPWGPGCAYSGGDVAGKLTGSVGFLSYIELSQMVPPQTASGETVLNTAAKKAASQNNVGFTDRFSFMTDTLLPTDESGEYYYDGLAYNSHTCCYYAYNYHTNKWVSFDTAENAPFLSPSQPSSIKAKIDYIKTMGVGGVMLWALDNDYYTNRPVSILETMINNKW